MGNEFDVALMIQVVLSGSILYYCKQVAEVVKKIELHDWRINRLEDQKKVIYKAG